MQKEPSRGELETFLLAQYTTLAKQRLETDKTGMYVTIRAAQVAYAGTLFYMRTGLHHVAAPQVFKEFMKKLDDSARS
jgi:hypothetical protein